jgi:hypothetical protein
LALTFLLYGCGTWAVREQDKCRITSTEMQFMRRKAKYTRQDCKTHKDILTKLKINQIEKTIQNC